jgi:hypothetical protein
LVFKVNHENCDNCWLQSIGQDKIPASSFRIALAIMEEPDWRGIARIIGRGEEVLYNILFIKHNTTLSKVERVEFEQFFSFYSCCPFS